MSHIEVTVSFFIKINANQNNSMDKLRAETEKSDLDKKKQLLKDQNAGYGYGGKFGVEKDRMDKSAVGHDYLGKVDKHASQKDYSDGFGGKFGVQTNRVDKSAVGWDHIEKVEKHESQKGKNCVIYT